MKILVFSFFHILIISNPNQVFYCSLIFQFIARWSLHTYVGQIFPFGILLKSIFPDGVLLLLFPAGAVFNMKCMGTCSQTAIANDEFGLSEGLVTASGDMSMQGTNRQYEWQYTQRVGNRQSNWRVPWSEGAGLRRRRFFSGQVSGAFSEKWELQVQQSRNRSTRETTYKK